MIFLFNLWESKPGEGGYFDKVSFLFWAIFYGLGADFLYLQRIYEERKLSTANFIMFGKADLSTCLAAVIRPRNR